jgi:hypothetical protein
MSIRVQPVRRPQQKPTPPQRPRRRPGSALPVAVHTQLSRQLAQVLRRVRDGEASQNHRIRESGLILEAWRGLRRVRSGLPKTLAKPCLPRGNCLEIGVSGRNRCLRKGIVSMVDALPEAGGERAVVNDTADPEQKIGASSRSAHLRVTNQTVKVLPCSYAA